VKNKTKIRFD